MLKSDSLGECIIRLNVDTIDWDSHETLEDVKIDGLIRKAKKFDEKLKKTESMAAKAKGKVSVSVRVRKETDEGLRILASRAQAVTKEKVQFRASMTSSALSDLSASLASEEEAKGVSGDEGGGGGAWAAMAMTRKEGYLSKKFSGLGSALKKGVWQRRYFVARGHYFIMYQSSDAVSDAAKLSVVDLRAASVGLALVGSAFHRAKRKKGSSEASRLACFVLKMPSATLTYRAESRAVAADWVRVIRLLQDSDNLSGYAASRSRALSAASDAGEEFDDGEEGGGGDDDDDRGNMGGQQASKAAAAGAEETKASADDRTTAAERKDEDSTDVGGVKVYDVEGSGRQDLKRLNSMNPMRRANSSTAAGAAAAADRDEALEALVRGVDCFKHSGNGKKAKKKVRLNEDLDTVLWESKKSEIMPVAAVTEITKGQTTAVLKKSGKAASAALYLSLVASDRSLDLEFPTEERRDEILGLFQMAKQRSDDLQDGS